MEFYTLDDRGAVQAVNLHTGAVRTIETSLADPGKVLEMDKFQKVLNRHGEMVWVPNQISSEDMQEIQGKAYHKPYSPLLADHICSLIAEGKTLVDISRMPGYPPYSTIARWRRQHPEFQTMYKLARGDRAEIYFHKIMEQVEQAQANSDEIALARLKTDIYKFAAKVCAPEDFAEKTTIDAKVAVGTFAIETGIRRAGDPGFNIDETKLIIDQAREVQEASNE